MQIYNLDWCGYYPEEYPEETTDRENTWTLTEETHSFHYEEKWSGLFLVVKKTLPGNIILRILINFIFDFQAILLFAKIAHSHLHYLSTSLVLKLLYVLYTSFLPYGSFVKIVQLFKSFPMIYSMIIFRKKIQPYGAQGSKPAIFVFL